MPSVLARSQRQGKPWNSLWLKRGVHDPGPAPSSLSPHSPLLSEVRTSGGPGIPLLHQDLRPALGADPRRPSVSPSKVLQAQLLRGQATRTSGPPLGRGEAGRGPRRLCSTPGSGGGSPWHREPRRGGDGRAVKTGTEAGGAESRGARSRGARGQRGAREDSGSRAQGAHVRRQKTLLPQVQVRAQEAGTRRAEGKAPTAAPWAPAPHLQEKQPRFLLGDHTACRLPPAPAGPWTVAPSDVRPAGCSPASMQTESPVRATVDSRARGPDTCSECALSSCCPMALHPRHSSPRGLFPSNNSH